MTPRYPMHRHPFGTHDSLEAEILAQACERQAEATAYWRGTGLRIALAGLLIAWATWQALAMVWLVCFGTVGCLAILQAIRYRQWHDDRLAHDVRLSELRTRLSAAKTLQARAARG